MFEMGEIRLRAWERDDLERIHEWENDFSLMLYSRGKPHNTSSFADVEENYEKERKEKKRMHYIVESRSTGEPIGTAVIRLNDWSGVKVGNLGTYLDKKYWNRGVGKVITLALLELAFMFQNLEKCEAYSLEYNVRAHRVLESCGFKKNGVMRKGAFVMGKYWDWFFFDILRDEYLQLREDKIKSILGKWADEYMSRFSL